MQFIAGIVIIGILGICSLWIALDSFTTTPIEIVETVETRKCMTQQIYITSQSMSNPPYMIIGEAVICANDWKISNVYGPDAETFYGQIELRDWDSKEFIEEESGENDTRRKDS